MTPPREIEDEFNIWYTQHMASRLAVDGFRSAARYRSTDADSSQYAAVYETDSLEVFQSPQYTALRASPSEQTRRILAAVTGFTRLVCEEESDVGDSSERDYLYVVAFNVPRERWEAYADWYEQEHTGLLMKAQHWRRVRRLRVVDSEGAPWTHLTFHYLSSLTALDSPERARARAAPMRAALAAEPWFQRSQRWAYAPVAMSTDTRDA